MVLAEFEALLQRTMGLDAASIGSSVIERAVISRAKACHSRDWDAYGELLRASAAERQELIEEVVVPETWFFRDREAFHSLARFVRDEWIPANLGGSMRVLSLPCSTGEEPYSIALTLFEAGLPANCFRIDAVDISARALARARAGVYGRNSFRGTELAFRDLYFAKTIGGWEVSPLMKQQVHFREGNLFDPDILPGSETYDVIFCRNVLIYFDRPAQDQTVTVLSRLLRPAGVLFVGPSETGLLLRHPYHSLRTPRAFAFRKASAGLRPSRSTTRVTVGKRRPVVAPAAAARKPAPSAPPPPLLVRSPAPVRPEAILDEAARLAGQGRLAETAQLCENHLRAHGPSARAYYLLGLVRDAAGNPGEAAEYFRKAIYLEPLHHEALVHLGYLLEKQGDKAGAKVLNERAKRVELKRRK